mmetsp:Transcript_19602/g.55328  ORF Transcript_19602/g.55328 Transcript_19602/m.55328 type:complete len:114 (+) Transcript_19602:54-395(+)
MHDRRIATSTMTSVGIIAADVYVYTPFPSPNPNPTPFSIRTLPPPRDIRMVSSSGICNICKQMDQSPRMGRFLHRSTYSSNNNSNNAHAIPSQPTSVNTELSTRHLRRGCVMR